MAALLMNLRHVPEDEAAEVRALLEAEGIAWYETPPSMWGISAGGIWLRNDADRPRAGALLVDYQQRRGREQRAAWRAARERGEAPTLWGRFKDQPVRTLVFLIAGIAVLLIALVPFLTFG